MISFCLGMTITAWLHSLPGVNFSIVCMVCPLWIYVLKVFFCSEGKILFKWFMTGLTGVCFFMAGMGVASWYGHKHTEEHLPGLEQGKVATVTGTVSGLPKHINGLWQFILKDVSLEGLPVKGRLRLSWYSYREIKPGQCWQLATRLKPPHGVVSPGAFDVESWLRREHVTGTGYVVKSKINRCKGEHIWDIDVWRYWLSKHIESSLPRQQTGLAQALLLGNKSAISQDDWLLFNRTGTTHLLVISGLHIGLMFILGCTLMKGVRYARLLPLHRVAFPRIAVIFGFCFSLFYALLAGFSVPVQRALIMLICGCAGKLLDFIPKPSTIWLVAMTGVLLLEPLAVTSNGFWYSFIAVASLLLVFSCRSGVYPWWQRYWLPQWSVFVALLPLLLFYGQPSTVWSPLINLVSIPLIGLVVVPALMVGVFISILPLHITLPLQWSVTLLNYWRDSLQSIVVFTELSAGQSVVHWSVLIICLTGALYLLLPRGLGWRGFALPCFLLIWFSPIKSVVKGEAKITLLNDKRTQLVVIQTQHHMLIYDMGDKARSERFNAVQSTLVPFLRQQHLKVADAWILPRYSSDSIAGNQLQETITVKQTYSAHPNAGEMGCHEFKRWVWDGVVFTLLPDKHTCVLKVNAGKHKALLSGTLSSARVRYWMKREPDVLRSNLWVTADLTHAVSADSSMVQSISPNYIAFSQADPCKVRKQLKTIERSLHDSIAATAYTGSQSYTMRQFDITVDFARVSRKRWWRYEDF